MGKLQVKAADAEIRQEGAIQIVLEELGYELISRNNVGTNGRSISYDYNIRHTKNKPAIKFSTNGFHQLEAVAESREVYTHLHALFERLKDFDQSCNITKKFVEVCDFQSKPSWKAKMLGALKR